MFILTGKSYQAHESAAELYIYKNNARYASSVISSLSKGVQYKKEHTLKILFR